MEPAPKHTGPPRLGPYELSSRIATGGMAAVYLARTTHARGIERVVALKVIHRHLAQEQSFVEMFLDEASIASSFNHPNICTILDFGEDEGRLYLAMEYLAGESLSRFGRRIAKRRQREDMLALASLASHITAAVADGLHNAHELVGADGKPLDVVHRDVSPENIVITFDGAVKLVDFGVAKAANRKHKTQVAKIKGKFAYVAPEQLRNEPIDRRADVWGLGVCLWETLVLRRLFRRDNEGATLSAVLFDDIPAPSTVRPWIPASLDAIVLRALERDPDRRYSSAAEMARELRAWAHREGKRVGGADLSTWMKTLFEEEFAKKNTLVQDARNGAFDADLNVDESFDTESSAASFSMHASDVAAIERAAPTVRIRNDSSGSLDAYDDDELLGSIRGRKRWPIVLLALIIGGGLGIWFTPELRTDIGMRLGLIEAPPPPAPIEAEPVLGELRLHLPEGVEAAVFVGRSPATVEGVAAGQALHFHVVGEGQSARVSIPAGAEWPSLEGVPTYELGVVIREGEDAPDEVAAVTAAEPGEGRVRVVSTPPGAKVFRVLGTGDVRVEGLDREALMELLIFGGEREEQRIFVDAARWGDEALVDIDLRDEESAED